MKQGMEREREREREESARHAMPRHATREPPLTVDNEITSACIARYWSVPSLSLPPSRLSRALRPRNEEPSQSKGSGAKTRCLLTTVVRQFSLSSPSPLFSRLSSVARRAGIRVVNWHEGSKSFGSTRFRLNASRRGFAEYSKWSRVARQTALTLQERRRESPAPGARSATEFLLLPKFSNFSSGLRVEQSIEKVISFLTIRRSELKF